MNSKLNIISEYINNKKILIWGMGREGISTYKLIRRLNPNAELFITDNRCLDISNYTNTVFIPFDECKHKLNEFDLIFKSPGIAVLDVDVKREKLTSQTEVFFKVYGSQIIGITGTKGKSTTSSLLYHIIKNCDNNTVFVGNIGIPCLDMVDSIDDNTKIVFELSCHQLEFVTGSPHIAVILNTFEEHLDHYGTYEKYVSAKNNIIRFQKENDYAIINKESVSILETPKKYITSSLTDYADIYVRDDHIYVYDKKIDISYADTKLKGEHNLYNIAIAYAICNRILGISDTDFKKHLLTFTGLPHRLEYVGNFNGIDYYDDSISTACNTAIQAIKTLKNVDTALIGGMDRGIDYTSLVEFLKDSDVQNIILMGETKNRLFDMMKDSGMTKNIKISQDLQDAVGMAKECTQKGKICLLSPAAASYDCFKNFEERGEKFKEYCRE